MDGPTTFVVTVAAAEIFTQVLLAVLLLVAGFNRTANRALAVWILATSWAGVFSSILSLPAVAPSIGPNWYLFARHVWFLDSLILLPFLANYPSRRPGLPTWATRLWPYLALAFVFEALQLAWPSLGFMPSGGQGPLVLVDFLVDCVGSLVVPIVLLREVRADCYTNPLGPIFLAGLLPVYFILADLVYVLGMLGVPVNPQFTSGGNLTASGFTGTALSVLIPLRWLLGVAVVASLVWTAIAKPRVRLACLGVLAIFLGYGAIRLAVMTKTLDASLYVQLVAWSLPLDIAWLGLLAYVALHDQSVGLNRKVRIGISRAALALIFLGVFFVVAQVAQNYLSDEYGYLTGGVAAGALLFAVAPLQRAAERLARVDKAAPDNKTAEVYREAVELTLADRAISAREERHLAHLAERLGIAAGRAMDIRLAVQESRVEGKKGRGR